MTKNDMRLAVAYYRVSTQNQKLAGNWIETQRRYVDRLSTAENLTICKEFWEAESGDKGERPQLKRALRWCKKNKAILVIASIDRLTRNSLFVAYLLLGGVPFKCADKPEANHLDLLEMGIKAERELMDIRRRTKDGIREKLKRGEVMGENAKVLIMETRYRREKRTRIMKPIVEECYSNNIKSERKLLRVFKERRIPPPRKGGHWHPSSVHTLKVDIKALSQYMNQDSYKILLRYLTSFTEDEAVAEDLLKQHYENIVMEAANSKEDLVKDFTRMLHKTRQIVLGILKDKPFDGDCWTEKKKFFPLSSAMSDTQKEVFCLRFYRDFSEQEISDKLRLPLARIPILLKQAFQDIAQQSIVTIPDILDVSSPTHHI